MFFNAIPSLYARIIEEIGFRAAEHSPTLISVLLTFLRDSDVRIIKQSIASGTNIFCSCVEEMILQVLSLATILDNWIDKIDTCFSPKIFLCGFN